MQVATMLFRTSSASLSFKICRSCNATDSVESCLKNEVVEVWSLLLLLKFCEEEEEEEEEEELLLDS